MKIHMEQSPVDGGVRFWFYDERPDGSMSLVEPMTWVERVIPSGDVNRIFEPTLQISGFRKAPEFLSAFAELLDAKGVKTEKDAKIVGTLDATRTHLEDLRALIGLTGTTGIELTLGISRPGGAK